MTDVYSIQVYHSLSCIYGIIILNSSNDTTLKNTKLLLKFYAVTPIIVRVCLDLTPILRLHGSLNYYYYRCCCCCCRRRRRRRRRRRHNIMVRGGHVQTAVQEQDVRTP